MEYIGTIVLCVVGCVIGIFIPKLSILMIEKKLSQKGLQRKENRLDEKWFLVMGILVNGILWGGAGYAAPSIFMAVLIGCLVTMGLLFTIIDLCIHIIPNEMLIITGGLGIALQLVAFDLTHLLFAAVSMVVIFAIFLILGLIIGLHKIGAGDVKLAGVMGLVLGYPYIMYGILVMAVALLVYCIVGITIRKLTHVSMFPFAPFLMIGMISALGLMLFPNIIG